MIVQGWLSQSPALVSTWRQTVMDRGTRTCMRLGMRLRTCLHAPSHLTQLPLLGSAPLTRSPERCAVLPARIRKLDLTRSVMVRKGL